MKNSMVRGIIFLSLFLLGGIFAFCQAWEDPPPCDWNGICRITKKDGKIFEGFIQLAKGGTWGHHYIQSNGFLFIEDPSVNNPKGKKEVILFSSKFFVPLKFVPVTRTGPDGYGWFGSHRSLYLKAINNDDYYSNELDFDEGNGKGFEITKYKTDFVSQDYITVFTSLPDDILLNDDAKANKTIIKVDDIQIFELLKNPPKKLEDQILKKESKIDWKNQQPIQGNDDGSGDGPIAQPKPSWFHRVPPHLRPWKIPPEVEDKYGD